MTPEEAKWLKAQGLCDDPENNHQHCEVCDHRHWPGRCSREDYEEPCDCTTWFTWTYLDDCLAWLTLRWMIYCLTPNGCDLYDYIQEAPHPLWRGHYPNDNPAEAVHAAILAVAQREMEKVDAKP